MAFSFLEYPFLFWRCLRFCIVQVRRVMMSWVVRLKQSRISLEMLERCSLGLALEMYITGENNDTSRAVAMTTVTPLVLF